MKLDDNSGSVATGGQMCPGPCNILYLLKKLRKTNKSLKIWPDTVRSITVIDNVI